MLQLPPPADTPTLDQLADAFARLEAGRPPRWGRMCAAQMTRHCRVFVELCLGQVRTGLALRLAARALGPFFLRRMLRRSPRQAPKNLRTLAPLRADEHTTLDLDEERARLHDAFAQLQQAPDPLPHPLYGAMPRDCVIGLVRHHTAHHLNQFGLLDDVAPATVTR